MTFGIVFLVRLLLSAIALVLILISSAVWGRRKRTPDAAIVALLVASAAIYCFGYSGEVAQTDLAGALLWLHVQYLGIPWIPALWLLLARKQNGLRSHLGLIFVIPVITLVGEWSNSLHGFYNTSAQMVSHGPFVLVSVNRGPLAWLNISYLFGTFLYGSWLYLSKFRTSSRRLRINALVLVAAGLIPLFGYLIFLFGVSPWGLDLAPCTLGISMILTYLAFFRFECFDLVPMSRSLVFNSMRDAALVTDMRHRLVDFNPAARELFPCLATAKAGDDLASVLNEFPDVSDVICESDGPREVEVTLADKPQYFEVRAFPLWVKEEQVGWTAILANVTARRRVLDELRRNAETDELTGVANRRSFITAIKRERPRSVRYQFPSSIIFVDLDHFKSINDQFGHPAGDKALCKVAGLIAACLRRSDLLSRYGGDEFAVLLPQTDSVAAMEVANRIQRAIRNSTVESEGRSFSVSVSIGVASYGETTNGDWKQLLREVDQALYLAKADGRNRVAMMDSDAGDRTVEDLQPTQAN